MTGLEILGWSLVSATATWGLMLARASAAISRIRREMLSEVRYWQDEAARAKARSAQLAQEMATWTAGCKQGREDMITIVPLLVAAHQRLTGTGCVATGNDGS